VTSATTANWATTPAGAASVAAGISASLAARGVPAAVRINTLSDADSGVVYYSGVAGTSATPVPAGGGPVQPAGAPVRVDASALYTSPVAAAAAAAAIANATATSSFADDVQTRLSVAIPGVLVVLPAVAPPAGAGVPPAGPIGGGIAAALALLICAAVVWYRRSSSKERSHAKAKGVLTSEAPADGAAAAAAEDIEVNVDGANPMRRASTAAGGPGDRSASAAAGPAGRRASTRDGDAAVNAFDAEPSPGLHSAASAGGTTFRTTFMPLAAEAIAGGGEASAPGASRRPSRRTSGRALEGAPPADAPAPAPAAGDEPAPTEEEAAAALALQLAAMEELQE